MGEDDIIVRLPSSNDSKKKHSLIRIIWVQLTSGVGIWGSMKPLVAVIFSLIPFLFLGQHFNRKHRRAADWTLLQIPLILTIILWIGLWAWSIFDAYQDAAQTVANAQNRKRMKELDYAHS